jgi:hypothetical protein
MLPDPIIQMIGMAEIITAIATAQHIGPKGHDLLLPKIGRISLVVRSDGILSTTRL